MGFLPVLHAVPRLLSTAPNEVWTWDISKLPTYERGVFLNLYVVLDLFSRYVVAWMVTAHENSALAKQLFGEAIERYGIEPGSLIVHHRHGAAPPAIFLLYELLRGFLSSPISQYSRLLV